MKFADIAAVYLVSSAAAVPEPTVPGTPARRLRDALEPIATQGWWAKAVHDRLERHGLGFLDGYVWGRAAALGEPTAGVVAATFGVFEPAFLGMMLSMGRAEIGRDEILAAREAGAVESLTAIVAAGDATAHATDDATDDAADDATDDAIRSAADALVAATGQLDATARPLFSGLRDLPMPASTLGRLWRGAELVREHRGDGHLAACIAAGLDPVEMSVVTELWLDYPVGEYSATRGYGPDAISAAQARLLGRGWVNADLSAAGLTEVGRAARDEIEAATDRSQQSLVNALGDQLDSVVSTAERVSAAIVAAGAFPSDPRKRAAG